MGRFTCLEEPFPNGLEEAGFRGRFATRPGGFGCLVGGNPANRSRYPKEREMATRRRVSGRLSARQRGTLKQAEHVIGFSAAKASCQFGTNGTAFAGSD
jgi:hypothetical protein